MTIEDKKQQENLKNFDRNLKGEHGSAGMVFILDVCSCCASVRDDADF